MTFKTDIKFLKGVGEKRALLYKKLSIFTIGDLLSHYPREYIDLNNPAQINSATREENVVLKLCIKKKGAEKTVRKGLSVAKVVAYDDSSDIMITLFNGKYTLERLKEGESYFFSGKISGSMLKPELISPVVIGGEELSGLMPIYPLTAGLTSKIIASNIKQVLQNNLLSIPDALPKHIRQEHNLCHMEYAMHNIHFPKDADAASIAQKRLIFGEFFIMSIALSTVKSKEKTLKVRPMREVDLSGFYEVLPFELTQGQSSAVVDIIKDLKANIPMNRLVQGDVGSGKTAVAAAAAYFAKQNNAQTAMMAPTEILAIQHYETLNKLLAPTGMKLALLTGSMTAKEKREVKKQLADGSVNLCIGTHALITGDVEFADLRLIITDEQHRFGVAQRTALSTKGEGVHTLVMSATPIPRTLALIVYGDLEISKIADMPKGRTPIKTYAITTKKRASAYNFIKTYLDKGFKAYIVCPAIEQSEGVELTSATEYAAEIAQKHFVGYKVGLLHGKMKAADKEAIMSEFKWGDTALLVATTVIEVGVDVPDAVVMLIENAERFGLSQLHQLRGRVGRGKEPSFCILVSDSKGDLAKQRLNVLCKSTNGFEIAAQDLKLRGAGDFFGYRQHGLPRLKLADLSKDTQLLEQAQLSASKLVKEDPDLSNPEHSGIAARVRRMLKQVGYRPN